MKNKIFTCLSLCLISSNLMAEKYRPFLFDKIAYRSDYEVTSLAFCPDDNILDDNILVVGSDDSVHILDVKTSRIIDSKSYAEVIPEDTETEEASNNDESEDNHEEILTVACSRVQPHLVFAGGEKQRIYSWNLATGDSREIFTDSGAVHSLVLTPDGSEIYSAGEDNIIRVWNHQQEELIASFPSTRYNPVHSLSLSEDGLLAISGLGHGVEIQEITSDNHHFLEYQRVGQALSGATTAISPEGNQLAVGYSNSDLVLWYRDNSNSDVTRLILQDPRTSSQRAHDGIVNSVAFSSELLVSGARDQKIKLWDRNTGVLRQVLEGHTGEIMSVVFSKDGETIASGSLDGTVRIWKRRKKEKKSVEIFPIFKAPASSLMLIAAACM